MDLLMVIMVSGIAPGRMQPWFTASCYGKLTPVKLRYPLNSIM